MDRLIMQTVNKEYRYKLLDKDLEKLDVCNLLFLDQKTKDYLRYPAREIVGNNEIILELHPYDIRLICILAMQAYYEYHNSP